MTKKAHSLKKRYKPLKRTPSKKPKTQNKKTRRCLRSKTNKKRCYMGG